MTDETTGASDAIELAAELTIAWLGNPNTRASAEEAPEFLRKMHASVRELSAASVDTDAGEPTSERVPAVSARKSLASKDHILSMIDGKPYKTLRRHLSMHGLTPDDYRQLAASPKMVVGESERLV